MVCVGVTGGIGSGKSLVCKVFSCLGIAVYHSDERAKFLTNNHPEIRAKLIDVFGSDIYTEVGINKQVFSSKIFASTEALSTANSIIHPVVAADFEAWKKLHSHHKYTLKEAAILFESGAYQQVDFILTVTSPLNIRLQRVIERDNTTEDKVMKIIKNQISEEEKIKLSDFVIYNNNEQLILPQVLKLHERWSF